jgi:hypothetical protein
MLKHMDLIIGVLMMAIGFAILRQGEIRLSNKSLSKGKPAKISGIILVSAFPIALFSITVVSILAETLHMKVLAGTLLSGPFSYIIVMAICALAAFLVASKSVRERKCRIRKKY